MKSAKKKRIAKGLVAGLVGGLAASWFMNKCQTMLSKAIQHEEKPHGGQSVQPGPEHGAAAELAELGLDDPRDNAAERTVNIVAAKVFNHELTKDEKHLGGEIAHYAFGATTGAIYGAASEFIPEATVAAGLPFGAAVWLIADEILVPALGLSKFPTEYHLSQHRYHSRRIWFTASPLICFEGQCLSR
ncbi:MAG TPA: DUF1440 domain-containing protein [Blastocatellia bacterium]|nr:DUF1440 domain-containing protein [Blastocatellia bacterium]